MRIKKSGGRKVVKLNSKRLKIMLDEPNFLCLLNKQIMKRYNLNYKEAKESIEYVKENFIKNGDLKYISDQKNKKVFIRKVRTLVNMEMKYKGILESICDNRFMSYVGSKYELSRERIRQIRNLLEEYSRVKGMDLLDSALDVVHLKNYIIKNSIDVNDALIECVI